MFEWIDTKIALLIIICILGYSYLKFHVYNYWKKHGIPYEAPSIFLGNIPYSYIFGKISLGNLLAETHQKFGQYPFHGFYVFHKPVLVLNDPEVIKIVLIKEFQRFCDRGWFVDEKLDPMSNNLFLQPGEKWKRLRGKFSPLFTPGKLKQVHVLMSEVSNEMIKVCDEKLSYSNILVINDIIGRYTTDILCTVVYGFNCNSLKNINSEFRYFGLRAFESGRISMLLAIFWPEIFENITIKFYSTEVRDFFLKTFNNSIQYRRDNNISRKDFLNLLMQLIDKGTVEDVEKNPDSKNAHKENTDKVSAADAAAQAFVFFAAGFETSSTTVTYSLLELALQPDIQKKLQKEIDEVLRNTTEITYDSLMKMEYLDLVLSETLRKYPAVTFLNRICMEDFKFPNSHYTIPKGMRIVISPPGIQNNPKYFPNPQKFDPSRFAKENMTTKNSCVNLAFGEGPRNCIGKQFGVIQSKQALASLLYNYEFDISDKTKFPIKCNTESFVQTPMNDIYLCVKKRLH